VRFSCRNETDRSFFDLRLFLIRCLNTFPVQDHDDLVGVLNMNLRARSGVEVYLGHVDGLGDMGADVIKIESLEGEAGRNYSVEGMGHSV